MIEDVAGKVAVITGGASGVGRGIAEVFAARGARVLIADIEAERLRNVAAELGVLGVQVDVTSAQSVEALACAACDAFGTVHIVVNNAGVGAMGRIADLTLDDWRWMLDVNLWGVIHGVHSFLPILKRNPEGGHIVNTASMSGLAPMAMLGAYAVAKTGVVALTEALALELAAEGSRVGTSVLCLGPVHSNLSQSTRNRSEDYGAGGLRDAIVPDTSENPLPWKTPQQIGELTVDAIRKGALHVISHPTLFGRVEARFAALRDAAEQ